MTSLNSLHFAIDSCRQCERAGFQISKPISMDRGTKASVMLVGLAPGRSAITARKAFAGNSARRLLSWFSAAGFNLGEEQFRRSVYLSSLNKCAVTPDNSKNRGQLWARCDSFLWRQIELVQPRLILVLGQETAEMLVPSKLSNWRSILGTAWTTETLFSGYLFPPTNWVAKWLFMPHPSGLSRTMNDEATFNIVIHALAHSLAECGFSSGASR